MENSVPTPPVSLENSDHALNNSLILAKIFQCLVHSGSFQDMKNARLVTKTTNWQEELLKLWRKEAVLILRDYSILDDSPYLPGVSVAEFYAHLQNPDSPYRLLELPYERLKLDGMKVSVQQAEKADGSPAQIFWNTLGPTIKHLKISHVVFEVRSVFSSGNNGEDRKSEETIRFFSPQLESLSLEDAVERPQYTYLELDSVHYSLATEEREDGNVAAVLPKLVTLQANSGNLLQLKLSRHLPGLQTVKLSNSVQLQRLIQQSDEVISNVKKLDLIDCDSDTSEDMDPYSSVHFPSLEHLTTKLSSEMHEIRTDFITAHSTTLKKLEAFRSVGEYYLVTPIREEFPVLTELRMWGNVQTDLSFLRFTQNLKVLHWDLYGFEKKFDMRMEITYLEHELSLLTSRQILRDVQESGVMAGVVLHSLEYFHVNCELNAEDIRTLKEWMPNLKTLKAALQSIAFQEVCVQWMKLEHLDCLMGSSLSDEDIAPEKDKPGLTNLKKLKRFRYFPECNTSILSDDCVERGFLQLPELIELKIATLNTFSDMAEAHLRDRIQNVKLHRRQCTGIYDKEFKCCSGNLMSYMRMI